MHYEYYVPVLNFKGDKIKYINVFDNFCLSDSIEKELRKYMHNQSKYKYVTFDRTSIAGIDGLKRFVKSILFNQYAYRCEYEYALTPYINYYKRVVEPKRIDVFQICEHNLDVIVHDLIRQHKEQVKQRKGERKGETKYENG